jgi:hypothetical protein
MVTDSQVKRGLSAAIVIGIVLGLIWGVPRYGPVHINTWNVVGLVVITTISLYALVLGVRAWREDSRDRAS